ncbi:trypsin-like peptidase domain-containing protein [Streptomyces filipinensis]|uniref:S1C family serine protease n=1 Tax=Streptomyces filipinensis TaxID=66887 RepID=UPI0036EC2711
MNEGNRVPPEDGPEGAAGMMPADNEPSGTEPTGESASAGPAAPVDAERGEAPGGVGPADSGSLDGDSGDFALARPAGAVGTGAEQAGSDEAGAAVADGDFELAKPVPGPAKEAEADGGTSAGEAPEQGKSAWAAPAGRPKPLHDPDPYGTPPYGEPGPWAPAPPVQHPAATPPQGTPVPPPPPARPASGPPVAGVSGTGIPMPVPGTSAPSVPGAGVSAPGVPMPVPGTPAPAADAPAAGAPATGTPMAPGAPAPGTPAPGTPAAGTPAPGTPMPAPGTHGPGTGSAVASASLVTPVSDGGAGDVGGRYDPWAGGSPREQVVAHGGLQQTGAGVPTDAQRRRRAKRLALVWTLVVAVVSAGVGGVVGAYVERQGLGGGDVRLPQAGSVPAGRPPGSVAAIAARALPSVVTLHVTGTDQSDTGTGFVLDAQGHILTNNHVVAPAGSGGAISVTFSSGDTVKAKVVGRDSGYDLAVVQVHGVHGLTPLPLGNSDDVRVGDPVVAIGAPFDLANTVTSGIISAKERPITAGGEKGDGSDVSYVDALQTDAPINPGNSGGPLLDSRAQVIGINSAIRSADSGSETDSGQAGSIGLGFAIPVNQARRVAEELINDGHATHPVIGVTLDMAYTGDGARIDGKSAGGGPAVTRGGPGERAGLKPGDVITEVDGERVHTAEELIVKIRAHRPGDRLRLTVRRDGTDRQVPLSLGAADQN